MPPSEPFVNLVRGYAISPVGPNMWKVMFVDGSGAMSIQAVRDGLYGGWWTRPWGCLRSENMSWPDLMLAFGL